MLLVRCSLSNRKEEARYKDAGTIAAARPHNQPSPFANHEISTSSSRMNAKRCITRLIPIGALLFSGLSSLAADPAAAPAVAGHWEGDARIIVSWCRQKNLHVTMDIQKDGSVTGKVGDAMLVKGRFEANRGWMGRKLDLATDHIVRGSLQGPVVAAEGITRESVSIPLNLVGGALVGGMHTSGSKFGGKEKMILSASPLTLKRSE